MSTAVIHTRPVITAWSAVSPFGLGRDAFVEGVSAGRETAVELDTEQWSGPDRTACLVPGFALREILGKKGTRSMDRVTGLAVNTVGRLLADADGNRVVDTGEDTGLVLGTTTGSVQSMMDFTRVSMTGERPFYVDPSLMPNAVMNCAAGQCAIWHELKGPNTTIAGGRVAGLSALSYAGGLVSSGRARKVLCGAAEEYSVARAWLDHQGRGEDASGVVLGEGCAMFLLEAPDRVPPERTPLAEVLAVESRVYFEGDLRSALTAALRAALARAGVEAADVWGVSACGLAGFAGQQEHEVLAAEFTADALTRLPSMAAIGDTAAASAAFQLAAVLSAAGRPGVEPGSVAVVTSVDRDGVLACAVLRTLGH